MISDILIIQNLGDILDILCHFRFDYYLIFIESLFLFLKIKY